jgi:alpha-L-rhamnosidase
VFPPLLPPHPLDLSPARWIWLPGERCLPGTFVLFRRELTLTTQPRRATGWIVADSRYRLTVNGERVQWGPAPSDPRFQEADPVDLAPWLRPGRNVVGVTVCYFGHRDGTWVCGAPGLLALLELEHADGRRDRLATDSAWQCRLDRSRPPGRHPRWYLRALQEECDLRLYPENWDTPHFSPDDTWLPARELPGRADRPSAYAGGPEYTATVDAPGADFDLGADATPALRTRSVPPLRETWVPAGRVLDSGRVRWQRDPADWFENRVPAAFTIEGFDLAQAVAPGEWELPPTPGDREGAFLTLAWAPIMAGWPEFEIDAPAGTVVEAIVTELADPAGGGPRWLDHGFFSWARFICREGWNRCAFFEWECAGALQLHVRRANRPVRVRRAGLRRRLYPWPHDAHVRCAEPAVDRVLTANVNTLLNSLHETNQDGAARERQQYGGDCGHQARVARWLFGDARHSARFLRTYTEGQSAEGWFLDCWPAADRTVRVPQRLLGLTRWGPILDHALGTMLDTWHHILDTDDRDTAAIVAPRLARFAAWLIRRRRDADGLLPVAGYGVPSVWMDTDAFSRLRHKEAAFNLYAAGAFAHGLAPLCRYLGDEPAAQTAESWAVELQAAAVRQFWCPERRLFVANRPWENEEGGPRLDDRSLAQSVLWNQCPDGDTQAAAEALAACPPELGLSYPANALWRLLALARVGRADAVVRELRTRWAALLSVHLGGTLQESWGARLGGRDQFSHAPVGPLAAVIEGLLGLQVLAPGFARYDLRPRLADLGVLDLTLHTVRGPLRVRTRPLGTDAGQEVEIETSPEAEGTAYDRAGRAHPLRRGVPARLVV